MTTYHHPGVDPSEALCGEEYSPGHTSTKVDEAVTCLSCIRRSLANQVEDQLSGLRAEVIGLREQVGLLTLFISEVLEDDGAKINITGQDSFRGLELYKTDLETGV